MLFLLTLSARLQSWPQSPPTKAQASEPSFSWHSPQNPASLFGCFCDFELAALHAFKQVGCGIGVFTWNHDAYSSKAVHSEAIDSSDRFRRDLRRYVVCFKERTNLFLKNWLYRSDYNVVRVRVEHRSFLHCFYN